jgi:glycosyltransferase involved in cell wall biosynthesis
MNILLINHYAGSRIHGFEFRPFYLAKEWVKLGHRVTIAAASFSHARSKSPDTKGNVTEEDIEGVTYIWLKTPHYNGNGVWRVLNIFSFIFQLLMNKNELARQYLPDIIIASSTHPFDIYPAYWIAKDSKAKLIFEVHDLWPLSPIELGGMSPWHPFILITQWTENFAYRVSDKVVSVLPNTKHYMEEHGMAPHKFAYIPNGVCISEWGNARSMLPQQHSEAIAELKQKDHFIVGYTGAHGLPNALHSLVESASLLQNKRVTIVLVGQGSEKESLQQQAVQAGVKNVVFLPPVPKTSIPALLDSMDVLFNSLQDKPLFRFGISPNKLFDYMMSGKPVIQAINTTNDIVAESGCGLSIPPENHKAIAEAIIKLINMTETERREMGSKGKNYVITHHDYSVLAKKFLNVCNETVMKNIY